jgi:hypothetical protein
MIRRLLVLALLAAGLALAQGPVYELRTYTAPPGKLPALLARFRDHTIRIFQRHNMESVGYWVPTDPERKDNTLIYILKHPSRADADKNWAAFRADPEWIKVAEESQRDGRIVEKVESVFMTATGFSMLK